MSFMRRVPDSQYVRFFAAMSMSAFGLNWLWEVLQVRAYADMAGHVWVEAVIPCGISSLGDVALILGIYGIGALVAAEWRWGMAGTWNVYAALALLGAACATAVEWKGLASGRWSYGALMPVIPVFEVGLWPLLQLTLLAPITVAIARWCALKGWGESDHQCPGLVHGVARFQQPAR
jgi:hypothetical protein